MKSSSIIPILNLQKWYHAHRRILPWRETPTIYRVWISEIMLQQTQVKTVIPFFERWIQRFPNVAILAQASEDEVLKYWSGLGYYRRSRFIHQAAKKITQAGGFPVSLEAWLELPGVGRYTAGAVLSIALNQPRAILDGNIERVLARVYAIEDVGPLFKEKLWNLSEALAEESFSLGVSPRDFNQSLMELGAVVCTPERPGCRQCPLQSECQAYSLGKESSYPKPQRVMRWVDLAEEIACLIREDGRILLYLDPDSRWRKGLWDFPTTQKAQAHWGDLGSEVNRFKTRLTVTHHRISRLARVFQAKAKVLRRSDLSEKWRWVNRQEIDDLPKGASLMKTLRKLSFEF